MFIEIQKENTHFIYSACFIQSIACYDQPVYWWAQVKANYETAVWSLKKLPWLPKQRGLNKASRSSMCMWILFQGTNGICICWIGSGCCLSHHWGDKFDWIAWLVTFWLKILSGSEYQMPKYWIHLNSKKVCSSIFEWSAYIVILTSVLVLCTQNAGQNLLL